MREIELLAPAADAETAIEAVKHGADAVYIGGPGYGARKNAANSIDDIRRVVDFAHIYRARVYVTVNTIIYDDELSTVSRMINALYDAGVDALIVQDMGILRLDLPPIALHASTQCDTRTPRKAQFLESVGFSQIVLARELSLREISEICNSLSVPVECFVHGALCVSYSGRCHASCATTGRSANRGECAQICRLPWTMRDANGKIYARDKHLLSIKDFNASDRIGDMLTAGVSSFKIEGRLKSPDYVKNVTAYYRRIIDKEIAKNPTLYHRSSYGESTIDFMPQLDKSFNRGFTHYFLDDRRPIGISQPLTPKSQGEIITDVSWLHNGDGISFINNRGEYEGLSVNGISGKKIIGNRKVEIPRDAEIHRTLDIRWQQRLAKPTATRRLRLDIDIDREGVTAKDERGVAIRLPLDVTVSEAQKTMDFRKHFDRLGNTEFALGDFIDNLGSKCFVRASDLSVLRRRVIQAVREANITTYHRDKRRPEDKDVVYPAAKLDYQDNVANNKAAQFYRDHGVTEIEPAMETEQRDGKQKKSRSVMTTRHCILREMGLCLRQNSVEAHKIAMPLTLTGGNKTFTLQFDCDRCEMHLMTRNHD